VTDEQVTTIARMSGEGAKVAAIARATGLTRPTVYAYLPAGRIEAGADAGGVEGLEIASVA
jgi:hypothetical protein